MALAWPAAARAAEPFQDRLLRDHLWRQVQAMPRGERPTVGLVLSAGGIRGLAHIGVIRVLEQAGFPIDVVAGTSVGAVIGALYAGGVPMKQLWALPDNIHFESGTNLNRIRLWRLMLQDRLASSQRMEEFVQNQVGDKRFDELGKPFACVAMDIRTGEAIVFREGPLAPAVRASMNLPGIFAPVEYRNRYLVDGGVVDYIPVDAARLLGAQWVIASVTEGDYTRARPSNVLSAMEQVIDIRGALLSREQRRLADVVIEPAVGDIVFYQLARSREATEKGVLAAQEKLEAAKDGLIFFTLPRLLKRWAPAAGGRAP